MNRTHGTHGAYAYHRRLGEPPCEACTRAHRNYEADKRAQRAATLDQLDHPSHTAWDAGCRCETCTPWHAARVKAYDTAHPDRVRPRRARRKP